MVVFTCNNCGDSLQKPKVAKHFQFQCRNPIALTCVDCLKDFLNDEYIAHTKCITEAERYGGKNFVLKPSANKGEKKQQEWIDIVNSVLTSSESLSNEERCFLQSIAKYQNIPRKKAKYLNFIKNALGYRVNYNIVESCWDKMENAYKKITDSFKKSNISSNNHKNNGTSVRSNYDNHSDSQNYRDNINNETENYNNSNNKLGKSKKKSGKNIKIIEEERVDDKKIEKKSFTKKKRKNIEQEEVDTNENSDQTDDIQKKSKSKKRKLKNSEAFSENGNFKENHLSNGAKIENDEKNKDNKELCEKSSKFDWKTEILQIFESRQEISLKKLKKKIFQKYSSVYPDVSVDKIESRFNKKLNKLSQLVISDDKVKLASY